MQNDLTHHPSYPPLVPQYLVSTTTSLSHTFVMTQSSSPNASRSPSLSSLSCTDSAMIPHTFLATTSLLFAVLLHTFHSRSTSSRCSLVTFFALPALRLSKRSRISVFSVSSACTLEMRSAVLSSELRDESVPRRILAVAVSCVVWLRRSVICVSRAASCSGVHEDAGSLVR